MNESRRIANLSKLISLPESLVTNDGRRLLITKWQPCLEMDTPVRVSIEAHINIEAYIGDDESSIILNGEMLAQLDDELGTDAEDKG